MEPEGAHSPLPKSKRTFQCAPLWILGRGRLRKAISQSAQLPLRRKTLENAVESIRDDSYDARIFELQLLYLADGCDRIGCDVPHRRCAGALRILCPFRPIREDEKHRQALSRDAMRAILGLACGGKDGFKCFCSVLSVLIVK